MRHARLAIAALALALLAPSALATPTFSPGTRWTVHTMEGGEVVAITNVTIEKLDRAATLANTVVAAVQLRENVTYLDPDASVRESFTERWLRASDGAFVRSQQEALLATGATFVQAEAALEPCAFLRWNETEWTTECATSVAESDGEPRQQAVKFHYRVKSEGSIEVPAGTFDARMIEVRERDATGTLVSRVWLSEAACAPVKSETIVEGETSVNVLVATSCPAPPRDAPLGVPLAIGALALAALALMTARRDR